MKRFLNHILIIVSIILVFAFAINFINFPEKYLSTWRYQLYNDLQRNDESALKYYKENYIDRNKYLFGDEFR